MTFSSKPFFWEHPQNKESAFLIIHGFTSTPESMEGLGTYLKENHTISIPLLPGHGTTWKNLNNYKWEDWYQEVEKNYLNLKKTYPKVYVLGLSLGGALALKLSQEHKVDALILINHLCILKGLAPKLAFIAHFFLPKIKGIASDIKKPGIKEPAYEYFSGYAGWQTQRIAHHVKQNLHKVNSPTLIFKSKDDHVIPLKSATYTLEKISSPIKEFILLENSYHVATMDFDQEIIAQKTLEFIQRLQNLKGHSSS